MFILRAMLREEYRMHASYSSRRMLLSLPAFAFTIALLTALVLDSITGAMGPEELLFNVNAVVFLYGVSVGALGFIGRMMIERRQGSMNSILAMPSLLPLSYRSTFLRFFVCDAIFYFALLIIPALLGVLASVPFTSFSVLSVLAASLALALSFLYGMALSFAVSVAGTRSKVAFAALALVIMAALFGYGALGLYGIEWLLPSMGYQLSVPPLGADPLAASLWMAASAVAILALVSAAIIMVPDSYQGRQVRRGRLFVRYYGRFAAFGPYRPYLAKELVDLRRSGAVGRMVLSFVIPLTVLSFTTWYVNNGLDVPVGFNTVFYAAMVGFFSVMLYTNLTDVDVHDFYGTLPVTVPRLIRTKLFTFLLLTLGISTAFVLGIALLNGQAGMLWLALPVLYVMSIYTVIATAYLTGLRPSSSLFDPTVLSKFMVISILPNLGLTIMSFSLGHATFAAAGIVAVLALLLLAALLFYRGIDAKWSGTGFN
jgi:hypothetical protein